MENKMKTKTYMDLNMGIKRKPNKLCRFVYVSNRFYHKENLSKINRASREEVNSKFYLCFISVCISFILGLLIGVLIMESQGKMKNIYSHHKNVNNTGNQSKQISLNKSKNISQETSFGKDFSSVSFTGKIKYGKHNKDLYPVNITDNLMEILKDDRKSNTHNLMNYVKPKTVSNVPSSCNILYDNIFWGSDVEKWMPLGYEDKDVIVWEKFVNQSEVIKLEIGCGRMQNRLVTFKDGSQACVRYRQNTDQIQGEIFSFYVGKLLNLTNLAPSVVKLVNPKDKLWRHVANDLNNAQWYSNRAVVLTKFISNLDSAPIPEIFKPNNRHLNKNDIFKLILKENNNEQPEISSEKNKNFDCLNAKLNKKTENLFVELAQWSDLIVFDYLTANLDRIVNNLFNFQWNANIMDGPAHNLAKKIDNGLLMFLDNESGLLHGYRLLKKYNAYHTVMLEGLCVYRKSTVQALKELFESKSLKNKLDDMFVEKNDISIRDVLPKLPGKNIKILHDRIGKVLNQVEKCKLMYTS